VFEIERSETADIGTHIIFIREKRVKPKTLKLLRELVGRKGEDPDPNDKLFENLNVD
jgi:hypothetical protein